MDNAFPCIECGLCCRSIGGINELANFDQGDGVCIHLSDGRCSVYHERPDICRVDVMYEKLYQFQYTLEQYYAENLKICQELKQKHNREV